MTELFFEILDSPPEYFIIIAGFTAIFCGIFRSFAPVKGLICTAGLAFFTFFLLTTLITNGWAFLVLLAVLAIPCLIVFFLLCVFFGRREKSYFDKPKANICFALGGALLLFGFARVCSFF